MHSFGCARRAYDSGLHELHVERDGDLVSDENAAGLERCVPGEAEILAIDLGGCRQSNARVAPRVFACRGRSLDREHHAAAHSMDRELAGDGELSVSPALYALGGKAQGWELLHVEEVSALQVSIALRF